MAVQAWAAGQTTVNTSGDLFKTAWDRQQAMNTEIYTFIGTIDTEAELKSLYDLEDADINTLIGAYTLGTFTGSTITDSSTIKTAIQELETAVEAGGGSMTYPGAGIPVSNGSAWGTSYSLTTLMQALDDLTWTFANGITAPSVTVPQSATAQSIILFEGSGDGTNKYTIKAKAMAADREVELPDYVIGYPNSSQVNASGAVVNHKTWSFDPKAVCDGAVDRLFLMTADGATTILKWKVSFEANPTTEADFDLKRADAFIGVANSAVMDVLDTTDGASAESTASNINSGSAVADTKVMYLEFGTAYTETTHQIIFEMWYTK